MRKTFFETSALDMPEIMSYRYNKSWKIQFSTSSSIIIIEDFYLQTFLHSLIIIEDYLQTFLHSRLPLPVVLGAFRRLAKNCLDLFIFVVDIFFIPFYAAFSTLITNLVPKNTSFCLD